VPLSIVYNAHDLWMIVMRVASKPSGLTADFALTVAVQDSQCLLKDPSLTGRDAPNRIAGKGDGMEALCRFLL